MSTAKLVGFYQDDQGDLRRITCDADTVAADIGGTINAFPAGPATPNRVSAKASRGATELGFKPAMCNIRWVTKPVGFSRETASFPLLTQAARTAATPNAAVTYRGGTGTVTSVTPEDVN